MALVTNPIYGLSVASAREAFTPAINYLVDYFETYLISAVTINIDFGWAELGAQPLGFRAVGHSISNLPDGVNTNVDKSIADPGREYGYISADISVLDVVQPGQNTNDLVVSSTMQDGSGSNANLSGATNHNPAGILQIETTEATVAISSAGDPTNYPLQTLSTLDVADVGNTMTLYDGTTAFGTKTVHSNGSFSKSVTLTGDMVTAHDTSTTGLHPSIDATAPDALLGAYSWGALSSVSQPISGPAGDEGSTADATASASSVASGDSSASVGTLSDILQTFSMAVSTASPFPRADKRRLPLR